MKVRERADQSIVGLVLCSHGRAKDDQSRWVQLRHQERKTLGQVISKRDSDIHRLMDKPGGCRLAIKEAQCDRTIQGFQYKGGKVARDKSKKLEVAPESMSADTGSERPRRVREIRKKPLNAR